MAQSPADRQVALALEHHQAGRFQEAEALYRDALVAEPLHCNALNLLGALCYQTGRTDEAVGFIKEAIAAEPEYVEAYSNLGRVLEAQGRLEEAATYYRRAIEIRPELAPAHFNLGNILNAQGRFEEAAACHRQAVALDPSLAAAHQNLGNLLNQLGRTEEALASYRDAYALSPQDGLRIKMALTLPHLYDSMEHLRQTRASLAQTLDALAGEQHALADPHGEIGTSGFYLAYQGENDIDLQRKISAIVRAAWKRDDATAAPTRSRGEKIRLGFVSTFFGEHTIGKLTAGLIAMLPRDVFTVTVFSVNHQEDAMAAFIRQRADRHVELSGSLAQMEQALRAEAQDILFYTDIGMEPITYCLAHLRLAPVQCVTWGHPVTTGIDTVDYFISARDLETEDSDRHYSETLIRLNTLPTYYYRPTLPAQLKDRAWFGLPADRHIYLCPQSLFKFHPDFDAALGGILRRDLQALLVLIEGPYPQLQERLLARLRLAIPDVAERIRFVPRQNKEDFLSLIGVADVMLDPFHFGGGNTSYEAFALGAPIVTMPSGFMRGRVTYACYRKMGIADCIAATPEEYVDIAVRLGTDRAYRESLKARILASSSVLYEDAEAVAELSATLQRLVSGAARAAAPAAAPRETATDRLQSALDHHQAGRLDEAEAAYRSVLKAQPYHCNALNLLGALMFQKGRMDEALAFIKKAILVEPAYAEAHSNLGRVLELQGELDQAAAAYRRAIEIKPDFAQAHFNLGNVLNTQGHPDEAAAAYRRAVRNNPEYLDAWSNLGQVLATLGRRDEAAAAYREALRLDPDNAALFQSIASLQQSGSGAMPDFTGDSAEALLEQGTWLMREGQPEPAAEAYRRAIGLEPQNAEAHFGLGVALKAQDHLEEAVASYRRAIELRPDFAEAHNNLGNALGDLERFDEALAAYQRAVQLKPEVEEFYANAGCTLSDLRRFDEAIAAFQRALDINPQHAEARANLGYALAALGRRDEAVAAYREALRLEPGNAIFLHHLNALEHADSDRAPAEYVRKLFDGYADKFDRHLTEELRYAMPKVIVEALKAQPLPERADVLDLGCGTGLVGVEIKPLARTLVGVDLSPKMIAKAAERGIYDELATADLLDYLAASDESVKDIAAAADVFIYLGDLAAIFRQVHRVLRPQGLFAFTVEANQASGRDFTLAPSGRYSHAQGYVRRLAEQSGFAVASFASTVIRHETGTPVNGYVFVLRRA